MAITTDARDVRRPALAPLVEAIRARVEQGRPPRDTALAVAEALRADLPTVDLLTAEERRGSADDLVGLILHAEASMSVKALVWQPGQMTPIHDHIAWCAFAVLQGTEFETLYREVPEDPEQGAHLVEIGRNANAAGDVSGFAPPGDIHRVHNTGDVTAISLHVYGADISRDGNSVRREYDLPVRGLSS
jgi:predicted metal-dependent enzyme (double-stranded beta helix superfamily)